MGCARCGSEISDNRLNYRAKYCSDRCKRRAGDTRRRRQPRVKALIRAQNARTYQRHTGPRRKLSGDWPARARASMLWCKYRLRPEDYDRLVAAQQGGCAVCRRRSPDVWRLVVDHCHRSGRVRGLLCDQCNIASGQLHDSPELALALAAYLSPARAD